MKKLIFYHFVLVIMSSCIFQTKDSNTEKIVERKAQFEYGIRGKVKFMGEEDHFSSITDKMSDYQIPAVSLAIINNGEIEWSDIYKNPDFTGEQHLDSVSLFQAASLSKPVTFFAALRMHAAGEIDLDQNIQDYLKEFVLPEGKQTAENPVTFRNIFSHTSGINSGGYLGYEQGLLLPSDLDILKGGAGVNSPAIQVVMPPNETLAYSGGAYTLAELALQDLFEDEFENIMKKWILEPVGMKYSEFTQPLHDSISKQVAKAYSSSGKPIEGGWRNYPEQAAAGLWSNATDMARFLTEIYKAYHGKSAVFSQSDIQTIISHERDGHVYGFLLNQVGDDVSITHYGGNAGYRTGMTISLKSGNGMVYLINSDNGGDLGNELLLSASQVYNWKHFKQTEVQRGQVNSERLKRLAGLYKWNNQIELTITFNEVDNNISLHFPNGDAYKLIAIVGDELEFVHSNTGVKIAFLREDNFQSFVLYGQAAVKLN